MTICIATSNFPPHTGGIATYYKHLTSVLLENGHSVIVLFADGNAKESDLTEMQMKENFTKVTLKKEVAQYRKEYQPYFSPGGLDAPNWIAMGLAMRDWLIKEHQNFSIDITEVSDYGGLAAFLVSDLLPPIILTAHGSFTQVSRYNYTKSDQHTKAIKKFEDISFRLANGIIANSPLNKTDLENLYGRTVEFSTTPYQHQSPMATEKNPDLPLVVSWLQKVKGSIVMADALRLLLFQKQNIQLHWVGGDTYTAPGTNKMSKFLGKAYSDIWNKTFIWHDEASNEKVRDLIQKAGFIVIPSEWETFSYVALEAASAGKAIIMTDYTGASYLFTHKKDAWIIPANDPQKLAEAIICLYRNPELCATLGRNAASMVNLVFNTHSTANDRRIIYEKIIAGRRSGIGTPDDVSAVLRRIKVHQRKLYHQLRSFLKKFVRPG